MKRIILLSGACSMLALSGCGSDDDKAEPSREGADGSSLRRERAREPRPRGLHAGDSDDRARILTLDEKVKVPSRRFDNVLTTEDTPRLAPRLVEHKYYARGVGPVLTVAASGESGRSELVSFTKGSGLSVPSQARGFISAETGTPKMNTTKGDVERWPEGGSC